MRIREPPPQLLGDEALVGRVAKGEEEADRHRLGVELRERVEVELLDDAVRARSARGRRRSAPAGRAARDGRRRGGTGARASGGGGAGRARSPAVPTKAVRAPLRSSSAFVAIVVPCVKRSRKTSPAPTSAAASTTECSCARTVGTLAVRSSPSSSSTASVKVPPTSIPRIATRHVYHERAGTLRRVAAPVRRAPSCGCRTPPSSTTGASGCARGRRTPSRSDRPGRP